MSAIIFNLSMTVEATIGKGQAVIVDGDISTARTNAKREAMRDAIENAVGVHVQSETEVQNFMVISDEITMKSDGYGIVNSVISEKQVGDIFYIELDVTTSPDRIRSTVEDLRGKLEANIDGSNIRGVVQVAIVEREGNGASRYDPEMSDYFIERMKLNGFRAENNDNVIQYMIQHANDPDLRIQTRRIARGDGREEANSILRGTMTIEDVHKVSDGYEAEVKASFEMIGLESSLVDTTSRYYKAIGSTSKEAVRKAKSEATRQAMESLAMQALETLQDEKRGGATNIKMTAVFQNINDYPNQFAAIKTGLQNAKCKIIRVTRPNATTISIYLSSDSYSNSGELQMAIEAAIPGIQQGFGGNENIGSQKLLFTF